MTALYAREEDVLAASQAFFDAHPIADEAVREAYAHLLDNYRKLTRESARLVQMSDRQERRLLQLTARLRAALQELERLRRLALDANPLTQLPGNNTIARVVQQAIDRRADVAVVYCDIDHFKAYNDMYGFSRGDEVLCFAGGLLRQVVAEWAAGDGFVGHVGGDDFVYLVPAVIAAAVGRVVASRFDDGMRGFYSRRDRDRGTVWVQDRRGRARSVPLASLSMAGVELRQNDLSCYAEVATRCAEVKTAAKACPGSVIVFDRRGAPFL